MIPRWRTWSFLENFAKLICTVNLWSCQKSYFCPNLDNENILFITRMVVFSFSLVSQCWVHNSGDHAVFVWFSIVVVKHHTVTKSNPRKEKVYFYLVCPVHHPRSQAEVQGRNRGRGVGWGVGGQWGDWSWDHRDAAVNMPLPACFRALIHLPFCIARAHLPRKWHHPQ